MISQTCMTTSNRKQTADSKAITATRVDPEREDPRDCENPVIMGKEASGSRCRGQSKSVGTGRDQDDAGEAIASREKWRYRISAEMGSCNPSGETW